MLFERCHTRNRKISIKQLIKYINFRNKVQMDHPELYSVKYLFLFCLIFWWLFLMTRPTCTPPWARPSPPSGTWWTPATWSATCDRRLPRISLSKHIPILDGNAQLAQDGEQAVHESGDVRVHLESFRCRGEDVCWQCLGFEDAAASHISSLTATRKISQNR